jgi:hypothetical protein
VLQALYAVTGGEQWKRKRGWMSAAPLSEWEGVIINFSGRVTQLRLFDNNLCGIISLMQLLHLMMIISMQVIFRISYLS